MTSEKWYNLSQASKKLGYGRSYVSVWLRRYKDSLPSGMLIESENTKMISEKGIEWIKNNTKKEGVLVNTSTAYVDEYLKLAF